MQPTLNGGRDMTEQSWWLLLLLLMSMMAGTGFIFGYDSKDTPEDNLEMLMIFALLAVLATWWVLDPLFPGLNSWTAIIIAPSWMGYLLWWGLLGYHLRSRGTRFTHEV